MLSSHYLLSNLKARTARPIQEQLGKKSKKTRTIGVNTSVTGVENYPYIFGSQYHCGTL